MDTSGLSMQELFRLEAENQSALLNAGLLQLERDPVDTSPLESLMRAAHSLKGAARLVRLNETVPLAHVLEDCFNEAIRNRVRFDSSFIDCLLEASDLFSEMSHLPAQDIEAWSAANRERFQNHVRLLRAQLAATAASTSSSVEAVESTEPITESRRENIPQQEEDRTVRVSSQNLYRLLNWAGESLVGIRRFKPFSDSLLQLRRKQIELERLLESLHEALSSPPDLESARSLLASTRQKAGQCKDLTTQHYNQFEELARHTATLAGNLYHEVIATRMRPFADGVEGFPRLVRDLARQLGKRVRFTLRGQETRVDRDILQQLESPLTHMVRNAIDHGIESPEDRRAAGKPEEGQVTLSAFHHSGLLYVTVTDDGRGVMLPAIREKIIKSHGVAPEMAEQLSKPELLDFLFLPGFSTSHAVTEISGRGFGLDVVRAMAQKVGGTVRASSEAGHGMTIELKLPLTLSLLRTLLVQIGGEPYALPLARIECVLRLPPSQVKRAEDQQYFDWESRKVGLVSAHQVLELQEPDWNGEDWSVILLQGRGHDFGVVVDRLLGERNLVVRPLDRRLGKIPNIQAASLLPNGEPVLILDADDLIRSIEKLLDRGALRKVGQTSPAGEPDSPKRVLVVDDSLTVREVERRLLESHGYRVDVSVDGEDGWNAVCRETYDLVITDIDMPRLGGIELVKRLRDDPQFKALPVMIVSYKDREEDRRRGLEAGADYYLTKSSFHDETLLQAVIDLIGEPRA